MLLYFKSIKSTYSISSYEYLIKILTDNDDILFSFLYDILTIYQYRISPPLLLFPSHLHWILQF